MKIKFSKIIHLIIIAFSLPVATFEKDIQIKSDTVEFLKEVNQIIYLHLKLIIEIREIHLDLLKPMTKIQFTDLNITLPTPMILSIRRKM